MKDASWFAALQFTAYKGFFQVTSVVFAVPTLLITFYLISQETNRHKRLEYLLLGAWLGANTTWMISELYEVQIEAISISLFSFGLIGIIPFLVLWRKGAKARQAVTSTSGTTGVAGTPTK